MTHTKTHTQTHTCICICTHRHTRQIKDGFPQNMLKEQEGFRKLSENKVVRWYLKLKLIIK